MTALDDLKRPEYPRANKYDPLWLISMDMGPNPVWLLEDLSRDLDLRPGMRVLDLGSGRGATSVFLAREFGVEVWAADLWVRPDVAAAVFEAEGVRRRVHPIRANAHDLPFARDEFDVIVSVDAFEYFGTGDNYLPYILRFLAPDGQLAIATPALAREIRDLGVIPEHIKALVGWEAIAWHTAEWWRFQWEITELVEVTAARLQSTGCRDWLLWARACLEQGVEDAQATINMLEADGGDLVSFAMVVARKLPSTQLPRGAPASAPIV